MNILIIDDHRIFSAGLKFLLDGISDNNNITTEVSCEGVLQNQQSMAPPELILLDYNLPNSFGEQSLTLIKKTFPTAIVVIISSEESHATIHSMIEGGAAGYIPKSSEPKLLEHALNLVIAGGVYLPPQAFDTLGRRIQASKSRSLTDRQEQVLRGAVAGKTNKVIANELDIAEGTVKSHLSSAYECMGVSNRTEAVLVAAKFGIGSPMTHYR
ncbi:MAG: DNA-binding NarL/FixJ family response regulator [Chitinophagales bacterium]|jgi:DNA-binding NarL/FixJ family response regulator